MNKKENQEKKIEEIKQKGKYVECHIVIDANNPKEVISKIQGKKYSSKTMYFLLMSLRETEKLIIKEFPEFKLLDSLGIFGCKSEEVIREEESVQSSFTKILREMLKDKEEE